MEELLCAICGHNRNTREKFPQTFLEEKLTAAVFSARRVTEHWHYRILRCKTCSLLFSSPVLPLPRLQELYGESTITYSKEIVNITASYARHLKPYIASIPNRETVLEIGCGNGFFLQWLKTLGFREVIGFEPSAGAVAGAPEWLRPRIHQCFFEQDESLPAGSIDLICSFQTLDHLLTPLQILEKCIRLLCRRGLAYFITHDERALQARILGKKSPIFDIEHIYLFNKKTLGEIFKKAGFEIIDIFNVRNTYSLLYWATMTPLPMKRILLSMLTRTGMQSMPLSLNAGNIGIVARRP